MCDLFLPLKIFFTPPEEQSRVRIFMWHSPELREGPHVWMTKLQMLLSDLVVSHVNSNFEGMITYFCIHTYINGGSQGKGGCRKRIRKWIRCYYDQNSK